MTQGEKMVWAVVYGRIYSERIQNPPRECLVGKGSNDRWREWEHEQAHSAIESACYAVKRMSEVFPEIVEGFGEDHDVTEMLRAMNEEDSK